MQKYQEMTREELRDYVDEQRTLDNIPYHVYSVLIDGIDTLEQELCEDVISREDVINLKWQGEASEEFLEGYANAIEDARVLPSVKPQEKMGHWNFIGDQMFECSECKHIFTQRQLESWRTYTYESEFPNYCPNCGARMESEKNE